MQLNILCVLNDDRPVVIYPVLKCWERSEKAIFARTHWERKAPLQMLFGILEIKVFKCNAGGLSSTNFML